MAIQLSAAQCDEEEEKRHTSEIYLLATRSYRCIEHSERQNRAYPSQGPRKQVSESMSRIPLTERRPRGERLRSRVREHHIPEAPLIMHMPLPLPIPCTFTSDLHFHGCFRFCLFDDQLSTTSTYLWRSKFFTRVLRLHMHEIS